MKKMVSVGLIGLAFGLVMPAVLAQAPPPEVQKWEQFCETTAPRKGAADANVNAAAHGKKGYQLVSGSFSPNGTVLYCYRRPAP